MLWSAKTLRDKMEKSLSNRLSVKCSPFQCFYFHQQNLYRLPFILSRENRFKLLTGKGCSQPFDNKPYTIVVLVKTNAKTDENHEHNNKYAIFHCINQCLNTRQAKSLEIQKKKEFELPKNKIFTLISIILPSESSSIPLINVQNSHPQKINPPLFSISFSLSFNTSCCTRITPRIIKHINIRIYKKN